MSHTHDRNSRATAGIAAIMLLLAVLAPTLTLALAKREPSFPALLDICTVVADHAPAVATPKATDTQPVSPSAPTHDHCPFCLPIVEPLGPPSAASSSFFNAESGLVRPDAQAFFFATQFHSPALARGPPARRG